MVTAAQGNMPQPLVFRINSMRTKKIVYCGVLEFVAPDEICVLPNWVFQAYLDFHGHAAYGGRAGEHIPGAFDSNSKLLKDQASPDSFHQFT